MKIIYSMYSIKNVPIHVYYTCRHKCMLQKKKGESSDWLGGKTMDDFFIFSIL